MRAILRGLGTGLLLAAVGCSGLGHKNTRVDQGGGRTAIVQPTAASMVSYLNDNARRMQGLTITDVTMEARADGQSGVVDGRLDCARPRNFRLRAKAAGQPMVDLGSNDQEFWYWISKANPPYVFHCGYEDLARGNVTIPFPFQPEVILAALGMAEYDPNKQYEVRTGQRTYELIETVQGLNGQPIQKVTIFNRGPVSAEAPQVLGLQLRDARGQTVCTATISQVQRDPATGAVVPRRVRIEWPSEKMELKMKLEGIRVAPIDAGLAQSLFNRQTLSNLPSYDLARRKLDQPGDLQRVELRGN
jgi:hypothetical protein